MLWECADIQELAARMAGTPAVSFADFGRQVAYLKRAIRRGRANGYDIRPTDHRTLTAKRAAALLRINARLQEMCAYHQIQPAVMASRNNDRVVVMPGLGHYPSEEDTAGFMKIVSEFFQK